MTEYSLYRSHPEFHPVDWAFGDLLAKHVSAEHAPSLALLGAMTLTAVRQEHSCLDLNAWHQRPLADDESAPLRSPLSPNEWLQLLEQLGTIASSDPSQQTPLVVMPELQLVFLHKYRLFEQAIADFIVACLASSASLANAISQASIQASHVFFKNRSFADDLQQQAVHLAVNNRFGIITGGPGTGKTTVLSAILGLELDRNLDLRICLAAPTGKASARMNEAIDEALELNHLNISTPAKAKLARLRARTMHSLLGAREPGKKPRYHRGNQLDCDLAVIDEASMASLPLMGRLIDALPPHCRLLLIGDKNQLTSVEAGSVLADLCVNDRLKSHVVRLIHNHRSKENPDLCQFTEKIAREEPELDLAELYSGNLELFQALELPTAASASQLNEGIKKSLQTTLHSMLQGDFSLAGWRQVSSWEEALQYSDHFKILAGLRDGPFGVINLNRLLAEILNMPIYSNGAPVMVLVNDYATNLRNGDIGICWDNQIYFPRQPSPEHPEQDNFVAFSRAQLPPHELVFAMTIHKSQGSGFTNVLMTLPAKDNQVLSRELVYTGISRARRNFRLWAPKEILQNALQRPTKRWSGLMKTTAEENKIKI